jgi:hypothetical protein
MLRVTTFVALLVVITALDIPKISSVHDRFGVPVAKRSNHTNPTHYGSPLDGPNSSPPINCKLDEDGLILASFILNLTTGKLTQVDFMWCAPNLTRVNGGSSVCPADKPAGATTAGAKPMNCGGGEPTSCFLSCTQDSDCGAKSPAGAIAVCAPEMTRKVNGTTIPGALPANMCAWKL